MTKNILLKELRQRLRSTFIWFVCLFLFTLMMVWFYGSIDVDSFKQLTEKYPPELQAFFGDMAQMVTPEGFLNVELFSYLPLVLAVLTIGLGSSILAKEEESGTLELLLATPLSRLSILFQKSIALILITIFISLAIWLGVAFGQIFFNFSVSLTNVFFGVLAAITVSLIYGLFALSVTSVVNNRGLSVGLALLLAIGSYFTNVFSQLSSNLGFLKYFSLFYYYDSQNILTGNINWYYLLLLISVSLYLFLVSYLGFKNRDVGV